MTSVLIYGKADCNPCNLTKAFLDRHGISYQYYDIVEDEASLLAASLYGIRSLPIVVTETDRWGGLNKEKLDALVA